jgi:hypothetical protein
LIFPRTKAGRLHLGIPGITCGYGRRLGRSRRSWQLDWNRSRNRCRAKQTWGGGRGRCRQVRGGRGHCSASKLYLVDVWGNSDLEFSQEVNAQNGTSHSGLQETGCKKFALKLNGFFNGTPRGDRLPICPFEKWTTWAGIFGTRDNAQCCPSINQIPVICQFVSQENETSIGGKMHSRGSGMCMSVRQTESGPAAN